MNQALSGADLTAELRGWGRTAAELAGSPSAGTLSDEVRALLEYGVARQLGWVSNSADPDGTVGAADSPTEPDRRLWELSERLTAAWVKHPRLPGLAVAVAAVHNACRIAASQQPDVDWGSRLAQLDSSADESPIVTVVAGGPLVVTGLSAATDHLGGHIQLGAATAVCRCGRAASKPFCDATCFRAGFDDSKDPARVADRRDTYVGQQVTVLDNRGVCQHSGLCTDRLPSVFHAAAEPFVTPSGGRMDEIVRAVRDCPSGALSFAVDEVEARAQVEWNERRPAAMEVSKDGPYRFTGSVPLVNDDGSPVPRGIGSSAEHFALCRCGHSRNKPFCSGMHWYVNFCDPPASQDPSVFEWAGGLPALTRMTRIFYERYVPGDELIGPLFANMSADHPQRVAKWLGEVFGGPAAYSDGYGGYPRMLSQHRGRGLTEAQRARWVELLTRSAKDAGLPNDPEFRSAFGSYIEWGSRLAVENSQLDAKPPEHMPMPSWSWQTAAGPPGSRVSALAKSDRDVSALVLPAADEPVRFEKHIKQMFRELDRKSMLFVFDLWNYGDVRDHAAEIGERLRAGTMPCDGAWPTNQLEVFARWVQEGTAP